MIIIINNILLHVTFQALPGLRRWFGLWYLNKEKPLEDDFPCKSASVIEAWEGECSITK